MIVSNIVLGLESHLLERKTLIQGVLGPRQVGKTTAVE
jgi:hypothetical protein